MNWKKMRTVRMRKTTPMSVPMRQLWSLLTRRGTLTTTNSLRMKAMRRRPSIHSLCAWPGLIIRPSCKRWASASEASRVCLIVASVGSNPTKSMRIRMMCDAVQLRLKIRRISVPRSQFRGKKRRPLALNRRIKQCKGRIACASSTMRRKAY